MASDGYFAATHAKQAFVGKICLLLKMQVCTRLMCRAAAIMMFPVVFLL